MLLQEALAKGYVIAKHKIGTVEHYRGGEICVADISKDLQAWFKARTLGNWDEDDDPVHIEKYTIRAYLNGRCIGTFAESRPSAEDSLVEMFSPRVYQRAIQEARAAIDRVLDGEERP